MPEGYEIESQLELLQARRQTLHHYLKQVALVGEAHITPATSHGISDCCLHIRSIKSTLRSWQVTIEDYPEDDFDIDKKAPVNISPLKKPSRSTKKRANHMITQLDNGTNLPSFGDIFTGKILDMDDDLVLIEVPGLNPQQVPGVIRAENIGEKKYRIGYTARVEVIAVKRTNTGKIAIELCPVVTSR